MRLRLVNLKPLVKLLSRDVLSFLSPVRRGARERGSGSTVFGGKAGSAGLRVVVVGGGSGDEGGGG